MWREHLAQAQTGMKREVLRKTKEKLVRGMKAKQVHWLNLAKKKEKWKKTDKVQNGKIQVKTPYFNSLDKASLIERVRYCELYKALRLVLFLYRNAGADTRELR